MLYQRLELFSKLASVSRYVARDCMRFLLNTLPSQRGLGIVNKCCSMLVMSSDIIAHCTATEPLHVRLLLHCRMMFRIARMPLGSQDSRQHHFGN